MLFMTEKNGSSIKASCIEIQRTFMRTLRSLDGQSSGWHLLWSHRAHIAYHRNSIKEGNPVQMFSQV